MFLAARLVVLASLVFVSACRPEPPPLGEGAPRLVLFLVVDQGRSDYLVRFRPLLRHGFGRLLASSVNFTDTHHDHARTTTAPGHATLASGVHPARHGIVDNGWYDRAAGKRVSAVTDEDKQSSPKRMLASTLGDWLIEASPHSKVYAASGKGRAAILTAGHKAHAAFWFDSTTGNMKTSDYYPAAERPWLDEFHRAHHPDRLFGTVWEPMPEVVAAAAAYDIEPLDRGTIDDQFPRALGGPSAAPDRAFYRAFYRTPHIDQHLADFAVALIAGEALGADADPDFLGLSFSGLDLVGHGYGQNSPEFLDALLRLDRALGQVLDFVDERIGPDNIIVVLTSDHGVMAIPEVLAARGNQARRLQAKEIACIQQAGAVLDGGFGEADWLLSGYYFDRDLAEQRGVALTQLAGSLKDRLEDCQAIAKVWTQQDLVEESPDNLYARLHRNGFHPDRSPDLAVLFDPNVLPAPPSTETGHGSPYSYDTRVPWLIRLPEGRAVEVNRRVHTVDVAPTLARLIGFEPPAGLDGVDRGALLGGSALH